MLVKSIAYAIVFVGRLASAVPVSDWIRGAGIWCDLSQAGCGRYHDCGVARRPRLATSAWPGGGAVVFSG